MKLSKLFGLLLSLVVMGEVKASPITERFNHSKDEILRTSIVTYDGFLFLHGQAKPLCAKTSAIGYAKAKMKALQLIDCYLYSMAPWPEAMAQEDKRLAWLFYREKRPFSLQIQGVEVVHQYKDAQTGVYGVVLAMPLRPLREMEVIAEVFFVAIEKARQRRQEVLPMDE